MLERDLVNLMLPIRKGQKFAFFKGAVQWSKNKKKRNGSYTHFLFIFFPFFVISTVSGDRITRLFNYSWNFIALSATITPPT